MPETLTKVVDNVVIELTPVEIAEYNARQEAADFDMSGVRRNRNGLLAASDWTQLADSPADTDAWATYSQSLRDVPQTYSRVSEVVWPTKPE